MNKDKPESPQEDNNLTEETMLKELKEAYNSVMNLKKSPVHRKITLDIEKKIRKEQKEEK